MKIHESGSGMYWTGNSREITALEGTPRGWYPGEMPALGEGEYARWAGFGTGWVMTTTPPVPPSITGGEVNDERNRRIIAGFAFGGNAYDFDDRAKANISGASQLAFMAVVAGAQVGDLRWHGGTSDFAWIAADNSIVTMDAQTVIEFGKAAAAHEQGHIFAARALKDADPIPADFTDDAYWP